MQIIFIVKVGALIWIFEIICSHQRCIKCEATASISEDAMPMSLLHKNLVWQI